MQVYNSLTRRKEEFKPLDPPRVGMYVCGPTVYGDPHLGHARMSITFDLLFRYLNHLGYKVRYVRNITDVGHLENDADDGEDKIAKRARLEQLEPMEIAQYYINRYHFFMDKLNVLAPSIEPQASGHIIEQQLLIKQIIKEGYAYESNGSVYFDVEKYNIKHHYGKLSGRKIEDLISNTRLLEGQSEKKSNVDFSLWKKASPEHIMRWPSEWSEGFPGWHLECSAMSTKYLGDEFDIHGGGMDLLFPHHECEIAQTVAAKGKESVKYWLHNNMITINGQKMAKSLGNFITLEQFVDGSHELLEKAYNPMTIRFFILQAHYRSTLDFSNEALQAAEKGMNKLMEALKNLDKIQPGKSSTFNVDEITSKCYNAMNDDLNTAVLISQLFEATRLVNLMKENKEELVAEDLEKMKKVMNGFSLDVLGLSKQEENTSMDVTPTLVEMLLNIRIQAKKNKDFTTADKIRDDISRLGISVKDTKDGFEWKFQ